MIEQALKTALERITGLDVYPLLLPPDAYTGVTYQRVSDPELDTGMLRTRLVEVRFQITLYVESDYLHLVELDKAVWNEWRTVQHGEIEGYPVQYIRRVSLSEGTETLNNGSVVYSRTRDFIMTFSE